MIQRLFVFLLMINVLYLAACSANTKNKNTESLGENYVSQDSLTDRNVPELPVQFRDFRDALYQGKVLQAKAFFDFPVVNSHSEEWAYIEMNEFADSSHSIDKPKPLSELDFERHFNALFPKIFIRCLLKIKSKQLFETGKFDTEEIIEDGFHHRIYASFDQKTGELSLNHYSEVKPDPSDEYDWPIEFSAYYLFLVDKQGLLKFVEIRLAG